MKSITLILSLLLSLTGHAEFYDHQSLQNELQQPLLQKRLHAYSQRYFTAANPHQVVDELLAAEIPDLHKEAILFALLTEISQAPPQDFHQYLVDQMKTYQPQTSMPADEGHLPVAAFNLNSRAHGIENIWTAYRSEQKFLSLLQNDLNQALADIKTLLEQPTAQRRPQWLGFKNAFAALPIEKQSAVANHLSFNVEAKQGLDPLISHVALKTANHVLIEKALQAEDTTVRQYTLRHLSQHVDAELTKYLLLRAAKHTQDAAFATSLMAAYLDDEQIQAQVMKSLANPELASQAAFALSQSQDSALIETLRDRYQHAKVSTEKNHILLALKLNNSPQAQWVLSDIERQLADDSASKQWLNSFKGGVQ